jgi:hypothetical protein
MAEVSVIISSDSDFSKAGPLNTDNGQKAKNKLTPNMNVKQRMIKKFKDDQMGDMETQDDI